MTLKKLSFLTFFALTFSTFAQVEVDVNFDMKHVVGDKETFDRNKYIVLHADATENDYNDELGKLDSLINIYDAYYGRETGRMRFVGDQVRENINRTGFADPESIIEWQNILNTSYANRTSKHPFEKGTTIAAAQDRPFYPNGANATGQGWFFSQNDTAEEPFGSATGQYMGLFMRDLYGDGGVTGPPRPDFVEVINEPLFPLVDENTFGGGTIDDVFKMHLSVADSVKKYSPNSKVGGFTTAFPDLERPGMQAGNTEMFGQWEERWRRFIDEVGPKMDFYSIHLYDFHSLGGKELLRKGSNMEATMDMIEHYNTLQYGEVKPWVISEYGGQLNDFYAEPWSPRRDWLNMKSFSSMMMQFMERPNTIEKTVPFALGRADFLFGNIAAGFAYPWRMMRRENEPASYTGDWVFTELVKFYQLWSDVKGTRVDTKATDADVMVDAYVNQAENKAYLILNSLAEGNLNVNLHEFGLGGNTITGVKIKHLFLGANDIPQLTVTETNEAPETVTLNEEATIVVEYTFDAPISITETSNEAKIYATTYKQPISANQAISFTIPNVVVGAQGEAVLRLGIGRPLGASRTPVVTINGNAIAVPTDYRGDIQNQRDTFFGVLEIPVPYENLISGDNTVEVSFSDDGGFASSCALQTFDFSRSVSRTGISDRTRFLNFDNISDFIPDNGTLPEVIISQDARLSLTYGTGVLNEVEEDLNYVAVQVRQLDELGNEVATSDFTTIVPNEGDNAGSVNFTYTIPTNFATPNTDPIPTTATLPEGHKLFLLLFMSVDGDTGFANANTEIVINEVPDRTRSVTFNNMASYIPAGGTLPAFSIGEDVPLEIGYATGLTNRVEEDLNYVAVQTRQIDELGNEVATSAFTTIVSGESANTGVGNFTYTIPTNFATPNTDLIPTTAALSEGHQLVLLIFMSVNGDTGFANANTNIVINAVADRERSISFDNVTSFIPTGENLPTFLEGQTFSTTLTYSTAVVSDAEEDLGYVAMQVSQLDENFVAVNTSTFQAVVNGDAVNADTVTFDYMLPTTFDDGTPIPLSADLPTGHKLFLLVFMSVNADTGFANANTEITITDTLPNRERAITFDNINDYIPIGTSLPSFEEGQTFATQLSYNTAVVDSVEEDLSYVAMQVRQLNESFGIVNTSTFQAVVSGDAINADTANFDYTLPTLFDDGTAIPTSADLPAGHKLFLLIFMSVDDDANFADANTEIIISSPIADRARSLIFDNIADYIPAEQVLPTFVEGQTFETTLTYATGVENNIEEDLAYVAMQVRQLDENFGIVNTSSFVAVVSGDEVNVDTVTFDYTLPTIFDDGTTIPISANLPAGHKLFLLTFMSVNGDTGFADANTEIVITSPVPDVERAIAIDNLGDYVLDSSNIPTFDEEQIAPLTLTYNTAIFPNRVEALTSVTLELLQLDPLGTIISRSTPFVVADATSANADTVTVNYVIPTIYDNGNPVLVTSLLPEGHTLALAAKISVNDGAESTELVEQININEVIPDRNAFISFLNRTSFIPPNRNFPIFRFRETILLNLGYGTTVLDGVEENLERIDVSIIEVNRRGRLVNRTQSETLVEQGSANSDAVFVDYNLPRRFRNGRFIPNQRFLRRGNQLKLVLSLLTEEGNTIRIGYQIGFRGFGFDFGFKTLSDTPNVLTVSPNPTKDFITINNYTGKWKVYSLVGKIVAEGNEPEIDARGFASGIYYIQLEDQSTLKFIKE